MKEKSRYENVLDTVDGPNDLKALNYAELKQLSNEVRDLIKATAKTKAIHLSSNLGIADLSIALLRTFDLENDKLLYDTGHQTYVHKILTGRKDRIGTIRETGGLAGFQDMDESSYDHYSPGHSGNILSVLQGLYAKDSLTNKVANKQQFINDHYHVAVIGDGALANGMAFEALNDISYKKDPLIIVINDNKMSIIESVGVISKIISDIKMGSLFYRTEKFVRKAFHFNDDYYRIYRFFNRFERIFTGENIFKNLGFQYVGPIDGHNIEKLEKALSKAKWYSKQGPVIVHVKTVKGKGHQNAENDRLGAYHSSGPSKKSNVNFSETSAKTLLKLVENNTAIRILNPAMTAGTFCSTLLNEHPDIYQDTGISEEHTLSKASGMALAKLKPYTIYYSTFLQRCYDQILHDVARFKLNLTILIDRADLSGGDGPSHHGIYDVGFLKSIPNITITTPRTKWQLEQLINISEDFQGIMAIRYPKASFTEAIEQIGKYHIDDSNRQWEHLLSDKSNKRVIISYGPYCDVIYQALVNKEKCDLINAIYITNYDLIQLHDIFKQYDTIIIYERIHGGLGLAHDLYRFAQRNKYHGNILECHYDGFVGNGATKDLDIENQMDVSDLIKLIK